MGCLRVGCPAARGSLSCVPGCGFAFLLLVGSVAVPGFGRCTNRMPPSVPRAALQCPHTGRGAARGHQPTPAARLQRLQCLQCGRHALKALTACARSPQARDCPEGVLADHACEGHARCGDHVMLPLGTAEVGHLCCSGADTPAPPRQRPPNPSLPEPSQHNWPASSFPSSVASRAACGLTPPPVCALPCWQVPDECSEYIPSWGPPPGRPAPKAVRCGSH